MIQSFRDLKKLPRSVWVLSFAVFVNRMGTMALPYLALYLTKSRGFPATTAGSVIVAYGVMAFIIGPISGRLIDKVGAIRVMETSLLLSGIVLILFPLAHSLLEISIMTALWALTSEAYRPASMTLIGDLVPSHQRKAAYAFIRLAVNLGMSFGPVMGGLLAQISYPSIFIVDGITTLLACAVLAIASFKTHAKKSAEHVRQNDEPDLHNLKPLANRSFVYFLIASIPVTIVFFQHISSMPVFLVRDLKFTETTYGLLCAINTALIIALEIPITAAITHWNYRKSLTLGSLLFALGFGGMAFTHTILGTAVTIVIWTFGEMILFPAMNAYVSDVSPTKLRGQYMGIYMACFSGGFIFAPWLGMQILDRYGGQAVWLSMLAIGLLSPMMLSMISVRGIKQVKN